MPQVVPDEGYPALFAFWHPIGQIVFDDTKPNKEKDPGFYSLSLMPPKREHVGLDWSENNKPWGHAALAVAFEDSNNRVLCKNSWGSNSENYPYSWMPYQWIREFEATDDFWMVRMIEPGALRLSGDRLSVPNPAGGLSLLQDWGLMQLDRSLEVLMAANGAFAGVAWSIGMLELF